MDKNNPAGSQSNKVQRKPEHMQNNTLSLGKHSFILMSHKRVCICPWFEQGFFVWERR